MIQHNVRTRSPLWENVLYIILILYNNNAWMVLVPPLEPSPIKAP